MHIYICASESVYYYIYITLCSSQNESKMVEAETIF